MADWIMQTDKLIPRPAPVLTAWVLLLLCLLGVSVFAAEGGREADRQQLQQRLEQLQAQLALQKTELETLAGQQTWMTDDQQLTDLQQRMLGRLEQFIRQDLPFHRIERLARIRELEKLLQQPEIQTAEKLRRLFKAFQQELAYGQTIEAWDGELFEPGSADQPQLVTFLRYGRVSLVYQSFDGKETAWWSKEEMRWKALPESFAREVTQGIRIALKRVPPDMLVLPLKGVSR